MKLVTDEIKRAEKKHPGWPTDRLRQAAIIAEEGGEVLRAALNIIEFEEHLVRGRAMPNADKYSITLDYNNLEHMEQELIKEVVQTGAMALRFLLNYRPLYAQARPDASAS
jgi:hypothetical protein